MVQEFESFYKDRYEKQRNWYHKHAELNRRMYIGMRVSAVVLALAVPGTAAVSGMSNVLTVPVLYLLSALLVTSETLLSVLTPQENWLNYRTTWQEMKREEQFFNTRTGPYDTKGELDPEELFIERIENLISRENRVWRLVAQSEDSDHSTPTKPS